MNKAYGKHLLSTNDWSKEEIDSALNLASDLKSKLKNGEPHPYLMNKTFLMLFYNVSTRTRVSFETAMTQLGGHAIHLKPKDLALSRGESIKDTAKVLSRYGNAIGIRIAHVEKSDKSIASSEDVYGPGTQMIQEYAKWSDIPVVGMADERFHG